MAVSYKKLFKLLIDRNMKKKDLQQLAQLSPSTMAKLSKDEFVSLEVIVKICNVLDVGISDVIEIAEPAKTMPSFKFIDLFSGIGGFHQAMSNLGGTCVLASEIDEAAIQTYGVNYGIDSAHDITSISNEDIPVHDVLCAG